MFLHLQPVGRDTAWLCKDIAFELLQDRSLKKVYECYFEYVTHSFVNCFSPVNASSSISSIGLPMRFLYVD